MDRTPARKRCRTQPRDSLDNEDEDHALDAMLVELGIPSSQFIRTASKRKCFEIIELTTPSPPPKQAKGQSDGHSSVVDLTTSPSLPSPTLNGCKAAIDVAKTAVEAERVDSFSSSPFASPPPFVHAESTLFTCSQDEPEIVSPEMTKKVDDAKLRGAKQARRLSGRLKGLHSETERGSGKRRRKSKKATAACNVNKDASVRATDSSFRSSCATGRTLEVSATVMAIVQMEKVLDMSEVGERIRDALKNHIYNGKTVAYTVSTALNCIIPGVIRWERKNNNGSHYSCAIYYKANAFLDVIGKSYNELVAAVRYLQTLVPNSEKKCQEDEKIKFFVIIEGMDRALVKLNKQQKKKKNEPTRNSTFRMISFADLHEIAFQLFMDVKTHTKYTCDLEASADYVALLTRELIVASSRATALEDQLESAPRYYSFRVMHSGETASASANAWLRMLQVIPGVSEDKAQSLLNHFPTFDSLMRVYRDPDLSRAEKEDLVADKLHDTHIQRALSKRIYTVFCEENPDTKI